MGQWTQLIKLMYEVHIIYAQCWKLGHFAMPKTCDDWLSLVNSCIYYAHQAREISKGTLKCTE